MSGRPSLERTLKYIPVVPRAQRKLGKEARRGTLDLRKLVGHANFLDTLLDGLDFNNVEEDDEEDSDDCGEESDESESGTLNSHAVAHDSNRADQGRESESADEQWHADCKEPSEHEDGLVTPDFDMDVGEEEDLSLMRTVSRREGDPEAQLLIRPVGSTSPGMLYAVAATSRELFDEDEINDTTDSGMQVRMSEYEGAEGYFNERDLSQERAEVAANLAKFDVGPTMSAVASGGSSL